MRLDDTQPRPRRQRDDQLRPRLARAGAAQRRRGLDAPQLDTRQELTCELTLRVPDPWEAYHDEYESETDFGMLLWLDGGGIGKGRAVCLPTMSIRKPPEP